MNGKFFVFSWSQRLKTYRGKEFEIILMIDLENNFVEWHTSQFPMNKYKNKSYLRHWLEWVPDVWWGRESCYQLAPRTEYSGLICGKLKTKTFWVLKYFSNSIPIECFYIIQGIKSE